MAAPPPPLVLVSGFTEDLGEDAYWMTDRLSPGLRGWSLHGGGELRPTGAQPASTAAPNPTYLAAHPSGRAVYSVCAEGDPEGEVVAHALDGGGSLRFLGRVASGGAGPCHCAVDAAGRYCLVSNIGSSTIAVFAIRDDLSLAPEPVELAQLRDALGVGPEADSNAHSIVLSNDNRHAFVSDLGQACVAVYRFDTSSGALTPLSVVSSGADTARARHVVCHPTDESLVFGLNQGTRGLDAGSVSTYRFDPASGRLRLTERVSTLPPGDDPAGQPDWVGGSAICISPDGRFLYCSNRGAKGVASAGSDSVAVLAVEQRSGSLTPLAFTPTLGACPRDMTVDPSGKLLLVANQDSHTLVTFDIDAATGLLTHTGQVIETEAPNCVLVVEAAEGESRRSPAVTAAPAAASPARSRREGSRLRVLAAHLRGSPQRCGCRTHPPRLPPPIPAAGGAGSELPPVSTRLSNAEIFECFLQQGFVQIPSLFSPSEMQEMEAALEHFISDVLPSSAVGRYYHDPSEPDTLFQIDTMADLPYFDAMHHGSRGVSKVNDVVELLFGERALGLVHFFNRVPGEGRAHSTPPHQDAAYSSQVCTTWVAIDAADEGSGCMRYSAGSHLTAGPGRRGSRPHPAGVPGFELALEPEGYTDADRAAEVAVVAAPGDLVIHHPLCVHRAEGNRSGTDGTAPRQRRAIGCSYFREADRADWEATNDEMQVGMTEHRSTYLGDGSAEA